MYFLKLEPGSGNKGTDRLSMYSMSNDSSQAVPMTCSFHGGESLAWVIKELEAGLKKYNEWKVSNSPQPEVETRIIELGNTP